VNVDLVAAVVVAVAVGRMVVEDYIDLGVDIVLHELMYLVKIIVGGLVLDFEFRRLVVSVFFPIRRLAEEDVPPESYSSLCLLPILKPLIRPSILTPGEPTSGPCPQSFEDP